MDMFQLFLRSLALEVITPFFQLFPPQWPRTHWDPLCPILCHVSLCANSLTILMFPCRMMALIILIPTLNAQLSTRCFYLGVLPIPLVCSTPTSHLPTASPSSQDLGSLSISSLTLSHIKLTMRSIQLFRLKVLWSPLLPSSSSRPLL